MDKVRLKHWAKNLWVIVLVLILLTMCINKGSDNEDTFIDEPRQEEIINKEVEIEEEKRVVRLEIEYEKFKDESSSNMSRDLGSLNHWLNNFEPTESWANYMTDTSEFVIKSADEIIDYELENEIPEKYKKFHEYYVKSAKNYKESMIYLRNSLFEGSENDMVIASKYMEEGNNYLDLAMIELFKVDE